MVQPILTIHDITLLSIAKEQNMNTYFERVQAQTPTRFWINNVTREQAERLRDKYQNTQTSTFAYGDNEVITDRRLSSEDMYMNPLEVMDIPENGTNT